MKIVFMGTPEFSVPILEALHQTYGVDLVVSQPDKPTGRKRVLTPPPIKVKAKELGIEVFQPISIKKDYERITSLNPTLIVTAAYGQIIPKEVLFAPPLGAINVHGSLLPKLRGGAPIQRAIMRGHKETGITIMYMAMKMDSGDIISQQSIPILEDDTTTTLFDKLSHLGKTLLMDTLPSILDGTAKRIVQEETAVTFAYNLKKAEEHLNLNQDKRSVYNQYRAFLEEPACYVLIDHQRLKIYQLSLVESALKKEDNTLENGTITHIAKRYIRVKVKDGYIDIFEVQLAGKSKQPIVLFMNGAGRKLINLRKVLQ